MHTCHERKYMGKAALKRCHNLDWLIEQIRQNVTSELCSVCWCEGNVKCRWNIVRETWGWNCAPVRVYSWHSEYRIWRSYCKQRGCSVSLLLWLASWGCLKITATVIYYWGQTWDNPEIRTSNHSELRPVVFTYLLTFSIVASGSYESQWEQVTVLY